MVEETRDTNGPDVRPWPGLAVRMLDGFPVDYLRDSRNPISTPAAAATPRIFQGLSWT